MRVYLSVDIEGIAGISHSAPTERSDQGYPAAVGLMVGEANAAIDGACAAGAQETVVNDSHGTMFNLVPAELDPRATVIQGQKPWSMVEGAAPDTTGGRFDVALFVGYHARAGHPTGVIAHTYSSAPHADEAGWPAGRREWHQRRRPRRVGDPGRARQRRRRPVGRNRGLAALGGAGRRQARPEPPCGRLVPPVAGAPPGPSGERAVRRAAAGELRPLIVGPPETIEVEYHNAGEAEHAAVVPGAERFGDRGVRFSAPDAPTAYRGFLAGIRLAGLVDLPPR